MLSPIEILECEADAHEAEKARLGGVIANAEKAIAELDAKARSLRYAIGVLCREAPSAPSAANGVNDTMQPPKPIGLPERVLACCEDGETLTNAEFKARIDADGRGAVISANLNATLHRLTKVGRLEIVRHGHYRKPGKGEALNVAESSPQHEGFNFQPIPTEGYQL